MDNPNLDFNKILKQVLAMKEDSSSKEELKTSYNYLYTHTPSLFEIIFENNDPNLMHNLELIVRKASEVKSGKITKEDADKEIVTNLNEKYIDPFVKSESKNIIN